jgi:hypothetical protein
MLLHPAAPKPSMSEWDGVLLSRCPRSRTWRVVVAPAVRLAAELLAGLTVPAIARLLIFVAHFPRPAEDVASS